MTRRPGRHLVVLAKAPRLGTVKRRLAADIGAVAALRFYRATLAATLRRLGRDPRWTTWLAVTPDAAAARDAGWLRSLRAGVLFRFPHAPSPTLKPPPPPRRGRAWEGVLPLARSFLTPHETPCATEIPPSRPSPASGGGGRCLGVRPQGPGGLGERMGRCFAPAPAGLPPGPVVIVGSDIPDVRPHHIAAAFRALGWAPLAFGPAADGGYWLVGARRRPAPPRGLFDDVRWSTCHALADTLANARGRPTLLLETLEDVDDSDAYRRGLQGHSCRPSRPPPQGKG